MRARMFRWIPAASLTVAAIVCVMAALPAVAFAAAPGPYVASTLPAADAQASIETTKILSNTNARAVVFTIVVDDPDGIMLASSGRSLKIGRSGIATVTLVPTLTYTDASQTRAVLSTAHKNTISLVPEGFYNAVLTVQDKTGATTVYTWRYFAGETKPVVNFHTPVRDGVGFVAGKVSANIAGPRHPIATATMKVDGVVRTDAVLTRTSNAVNSLEWTPSPALSEGVHVVEITAANTGGYSNTYSWWFVASPTQPSFTDVYPADGAQIVPDGGGTIDFRAFCQDADGLDLSSIVLTVDPPDGPAFDVVPTTSARVASAWRNVDLDASIPITAESDDVAVTATARDLTGTTFSETFTYHLPASPPVIDQKVPAVAPSTTTFAVGARVRDTGSGVDTSTIVLRIDGALATPTLSATDGGYVVSHTGTFADNSSHTASITVANNDGVVASDSWDFQVHAVPVASALQPSQGTTYTYEDVALSVRFTEPVDGVDPSSAELYFDGVRVPAEDVTVHGVSGNTVVDVSATVLNIGGAGSTTHTARAVITDTNGYAASVTWSFTVVPKTGQADMVIDTNQPCLSSSCHDMAIDDFDTWNTLHWIVGEATGWDVPMTNSSHKYNCNICHYTVYDPVTRTNIPQPVDVIGLPSCKLCHLLNGQDPGPEGPHGGNGTPYDYRFRDHEDTSTYAINTPSYGRDCLYCHQGPKGTQRVDNFTNNTTTRAHDIVGDHRMDLPDGCEECHSAVLSREHAVNREGTDRIDGCEDCHDSDRPEVLAAIRSYPALRYRFWGTQDATYTNTPGAPFAVETTASYEIAGESIVGGRVRLVCSTQGTLVVEGYREGGWQTVYSKRLGGTGDGSPGGDSSAKPFPTYPSVTETFACDPVQRVRVRYTPETPGWHYVSANVDSWKLDGAVLGTCGDCHVYDPNHGYDPLKHVADVATQLLTGLWPAPGDAALYNPPYPYSAACGDCHEMSLASLHTTSTASSFGRGCSTCHPSPRNTLNPWDKTCTQGGCHPAGSSAAQHSGIDDAHAVSTTSAEQVANGCSATWTDGGIVYACHYLDLVQEHNRTITGGGTIPWDVIDVSCVDCHMSAAFGALAGAWDGSCEACHPASHGVAGSARAQEVYSSHNNMLDGAVQPYRDVSGSHVGTNVIDAHGPKPVPTTASKSGCSTIHCHGNGYLAPGFVPYSGTATVQCTDCHGANVLVTPPPVVNAGAYSWFCTGDYYATPPAKYGMAVMSRSIGVLPAGSHLQFVARFMMSSAWDYWSPYVSTNGTTWTRLTPTQETLGDIDAYDSGYSDWTGDTGGAWVTTDWDLSQWANGTNTVWIRFAFVNYMDAGGGLYIDNIAAGAPGAPSVFTDNAETDTSSLWIRQSPWIRKAN